LSPRNKEPQFPNFKFYEEQNGDFYSLHKK